MVVIRILVLSLVCPLALSEGEIIQAGNTSTGKSTNLFQVGYIGTEDFDSVEVQTQVWTRYA